MVEVPTSSATRRRVSAWVPSVAIRWAAASMRAMRTGGPPLRGSRAMVDKDAIALLYQLHSVAMAAAPVAAPLSAAASAAASTEREATIRHEHRHAHP